MMGANTLCMFIYGFFMALIGNPPINVVKCDNITDVERLHADLLAGYNKNIRPIVNQSAPVEVFVNAYLRSIQELNEVTEEFSYIGAFEMSWEDCKLKWNPDDYGGTGVILLQVNDVWIPDLVLVSPSEDTDTMIKKWQKVRLTKDGTAHIVIGGKVSTVCPINVEKFPFDKQECRVNLSAWGYGAQEVRLTSSTKHIDTRLYSKNLMWDLKHTETVGYVLDRWPAYDVIFHLERRSAFTVVSFITPLVFMNFLHILVFVLAPESGERVSYSITVLLAIAVFMTIIADVLPSSSEPVPVITFKLMIDLINSVLMTMVTIFNTRIFHMNEKRKIPRLLLKMYHMRCCLNKTKTIASDNQVNNNQVQVIELINAIDRQLELKQPKQPKDPNEFVEPRKCHVTWRQISHMIDEVAMVLFLIFSLINFTYFFVRVL